MHDRNVSVNGIQTTNRNERICPICHESRYPSRAKFVHVRPGLNEPPEPVMCRCRDTSIISNSIQNKIAGAYTVQQLVQTRSWTS